MKGKTPRVLRCTKFSALDYYHCVRAAMSQSLALTSKQLTSGHKSTVIIETANTTYIFLETQKIEKFANVHQKRNFYKIKST